MNEATRKFTPTKQVKIRSLHTGSGKAKKALPFGRKVGHLKVGPDRPIGKTQRYYAACDCGHTDWYEAQELREMLERWGGCGQPTCTALSFNETVWASEESLRLQLFFLLALCPDRVQSDWGGKLDDMYELDLDQGLANLQSYLTDHGYSGVWLSRYDEGLPFLEDNVYLSNKPDKSLRGFALSRIEVDEEMFTMHELCQLSGLAPFALLMKMYELGTTDDLIFNLMGEE
ncbi:MAG: hypothetical protein C0610_17105 [Desulfobacteraceae bacterium]|nr:MAG: hypothetical protein C0610_17105 [Desulfobacteraceae bacterium]